MDHQERGLGFRSVLAQDFPGLRICEVNDHVLTDDDYYRMTARVPVWRALFAMPEYGSIIPRMIRSPSRCKQRPSMLLL
jgi:hypothetical protein